MVTCLILDEILHFAHKACPSLPTADALSQDIAGFGNKIITPFFSIYTTISGFWVLAHAVI